MSEGLFRKWWMEQQKKEKFEWEKKDEKSYSASIVIHG